MAAADIRANMAGADLVRLVENNKTVFILRQKDPMKELLEKNKELSVRRKI